MANTVRGGDIRRFMFNGVEYSPAMDAEFSYVPGKNGRQEIETTLLGNGEVASTSRIRPVGITSGTLSIRPSNGDVENLHRDNDGEEHPCVMELADGTTYSGSLVLNGEMIPDSMGQIEFVAIGRKFESI